MGMDQMVSKVQAVLPKSPSRLIRKDLERTRSVDDTITNILEGRVQLDVNDSNTATSSRSTPESSKLRRRGATFQEKKKAMIEEQRRIYLEKRTRKFDS